MSKTRYLIVLLFSLNIFAEWKIQEESGDITVYTEGNISVGDKYRFILSRNTEDPCNIAGSYFTNYTMVKNAEKKLNNLPSIYFLAEINQKEKTIVASIVTGKFLSGAISYFFATRNNIEDIVDYYSGEEVISIELLGFYDIDKHELLDVNIEDYFDIPINTWNLAGHEEALKKGKEECLLLDE